MPRKLKPPTADPNCLSTREKVILLNGSKLNGCKFWPWERDPVPTDFLGSEFFDDTEFRLSAEQLELFSGWKRPPKQNSTTSQFEKSALTQDEELALPQAGASMSPQDPRFTSRRAGALAGHDPEHAPVDLVQDVATDCSVVASLCAVTARTELLGQDSCIAGITFPGRDYPTNRKFIYKFNFNGCYRKVEVDDRLPASQSSRALHVFDRRNPETFWPALIEKAYLKVRGGYDFPGSNSGTDLWVLTGWIPEQLFLQSEDLIPHAFWKRVLTAFNYGDVLLTIGTGKLSHQEERALGLASEHAYAIIGMKEDGSHRLFHIKNPWSHGGIWTGSQWRQSSEPEQDSKHVEEAVMPGTFWMDLNHIFQNFVTIYLNWNPGLFGHRYDVHFVWDLHTRSSPESFSNNPQYLLRSRKGGSVWLLLNKHFQTVSEAALDDDKTDPRLQSGFLSLYAFEAQFRVTLASGSLLRAPYVDAPNILLRFEMPADTSYIVVPSEQGMPSAKHPFTLSAFSTNPLAEFAVAEQRFHYSLAGSGAWTLTSSGGNAGSPDFYINPQFRLDLPRTSDLAIVLETTEAELAIQIKLVWAGGNRIPHALTKRDIYGDSGEYRRGCTRAEVPQVLAGRYTIVCSTFQPGQLGEFTLKVWSMTDGCALTSIPIDEPGMFCTVLPRAVFPYSVDRILAPVFVKRLTRFYARAKSLQCPGIVKPSPLKVSLEFGQGANKFVLASTDDFVEAFHGAIRIPELDLKPQMCSDGSPGLWLVVERMGGGVEQEEIVHLEAFSSEMGFHFGAWGQAIDEPIEAFRRRLNIRP